MFVVLVHLDFVYIMFEGQSYRSKQCPFQASLGKTFPPKDHGVQLRGVQFIVNCRHINCRHEKTQVPLIASRKCLRDHVVIL